MMHNYIISQEKAGFVTYSTYESASEVLEANQGMPLETRRCELNKMYYSVSYGN
jgi:hypothetical protein